METVVGLDLGGTYIKAGLVTREGKILKKIQMPTLAEQEKQHITLNQMQKAIDFAIEGVAKENLAGIGIGSPGLVNKEGVVFSAPNLPEWTNVPLKKIFEQKYELPVVIENDVNSITWGEFLFGAGKGTNSIICTTLGTGLGGGIVMNGKLLTGSSYSAMEIGHITIDYKGPQCKCGSFGCIERFVGRDYIVERAVQAIQDGKKTLISTIVKGNLGNITPQIISEASDKGDELACQIWKDVGVCLGALFAGLVNLVNPDRIIIGGGVAQAGEVLFEPIRKTISERTMNPLAQNVQVVPAGLGTDAGIISGAALIFQNNLLPANRSRTF